MSLEKLKARIAGKRWQQDEAIHNSQPVPDEAPWCWIDIDELAALIAVAEAAQAYVDRIEAEAAAVEPWNAPEIDGGIVAALALLDA